MEAEHVLLGDLLVKAGLVTTEQVSKALGRQSETGKRLGEELVSLGYITELQVTQVLSNQLSVPWVSLYHVEFTRELLSLVPATVAEAHTLIPVYVRKVRNAGETVFVAMVDPTNPDALAAVQQASGLPVKPMVAPPTEIRNAIRVYYFGGRPLSASRRPAPPTASEDTRPDIATPDDKPGKPESEIPTIDVMPDPDDSTKPAAPAAGPSPGAAPPVGDVDDGRPARTTRKLPRMVTLTLLDGTAVRLPAPGQTQSEDTDSGALTASDLITALQARAQGKNVDDVLQGDSWEVLFATLLNVLLRKGLIADWEFVEEWNRQRAK